MKMIIRFCLTLLLMLSQQVLAQVNVLACEPEWAALAVTIGGKQVNVHSATTALQDPHHVQARPSLIAKTRRADLLICSGSELEIGWLPVLLRKSGNKKIQPGSSGYFMATSYVELLDQRKTVDRSEGDVHASGNPHIHTNPQHLLTVAKALSEKLSTIDPANAKHYHLRHQLFSEQLTTSLKQWQVKIKRLNGKHIVVHHDSWLYLAQWLKLKKVATLEPKPGVPPSSGHLSSLLTQLKSNPADMIIYASYQDDRASNWLSKKSGVPKVALPYSVNNWQKDNAITYWYQKILDNLLAALP